MGYHHCERCGAVYAKRVTECRTCGEAPLLTLIIKNLILFTVCVALTVAFIYHEVFYPFSALLVLALFAAIKVGVWAAG